MRFELIISNPALENSALTELIFQGIEKQADKIVIPTGLIGACKVIYPQAPFSALISYPYGIEPLSVKINEITAAAKAGVKTIDLLINQFFIRNLEYKRIVAEYQNIQTFCKQFEIDIRCVIEHRLESLSRNVKIAQVLESAGAETVVTGTGLIYENTPDAILSCYKIKENTSLEVITYSHNWSADYIKILKSAGGTLARVSNPSNIF
jgi:deoxyribose-phosphate aldolase